MDKIIGAIILTIVFVTGGVILSARAPSGLATAPEVEMTRTEADNATITTKLMPIETTPVIPEKSIPVAEVQTPETVKPQAPTETAPATPTSETEAPAISVVTHSDTGFSPATITVKEGDSLLFVNRSSGQMWVASNVHPVHTDYPEFDQKGSAGSGESFQFIFAKKGTWKYHNHVNPGKTGTVTVE